MSPRPSLPPPACSKCGSSRTSVTGKCAVPPVTFVRCDSCGYMTTVVTR